MGNERFIFSVIIPIYNVEAYLEDAIESVIGQTIGFDNIQLILVNDGSPDESFRICEKYQARYPGNVLYIKKENGGVSSARNTGLSKAEGIYVTFLDGDDAWDSNAFRLAAEFFENNKDVFDVCSCRIRYSGDYDSKTHPLDYKFEEGEKIVDLEKSPELVSSTIGNTVLRRSALGSAAFREGLSAGEDSEFINTVLINKPVLGIQPDAIYLYRRNIQAGSGSASAPTRRSWYLDVPREFYGSLCSKSFEKYGKVVPFIQHAILYDMRWRFNNSFAEKILTEEERSLYIETLHQILKDFDAEVIYSIKGQSQYRKLYYMNLKYGKEVIAEAELADHRFFFDGCSVIGLRKKTVFVISALEIENGYLRIEGLSRASVIKRPYSIFASDGNKKYPVELYRYTKGDVRGYAGDIASEAYGFKVLVPARAGTAMSFHISTEGKDIRLWPGYRAYICHMPDEKGNRYENGYCLRSGYLIRCGKREISLFDYSLKTLLSLESRAIKEIHKKEGMSGASQRIREFALENHIKKSRLRKRVAFITIRTENELQGNIKRVYDMLDAPKVMIAKKELNKGDQRFKAVRTAFSSKVIVTDDYLFVFKEYGKRRGQHFVQLWHASGAGKSFGKDGGAIFPPIDRLYHKDYDLVTVNGETSVEAYASAFDIPADRVKAVGVARTDIFFDEDEIKKTRERVLTLHPELKGKKVILYTPTFRDIPGIGRSIFRPELDFSKLSEALLPDQIFVVKPHPVMTERIVDRSYDNVTEISDVEANDLMIVSDLMITDYSSTIFEYALLRKPMAFFCYDYDEYDRRFYFDFEHELPGELLRTQEELFEYLRQAEHRIRSEYEVFYDRYKGACDGHSTERIVGLIKKMLDE